MSTLTNMDLTNGSVKIAAKEVKIIIKKLRDATGVNIRHLAEGVAMPESQLSRMATKETGVLKGPTVRPLGRIELLVKEAGKVLTRDGVKKWISTPNPYLNDLPPILCLRSDKELEKVLALLASIGYGFPA